MQKQRFYPLQVFGGKLFAANRARGGGGGGGYNS